MASGCQGRAPGESALGHRVGQTARITHFRQQVAVWARELLPILDQPPALTFGTPVDLELGCTCPGIFILNFDVLFTTDFFALIFVLKNISFKHYVS